MVTIKVKDGTPEGTRSLCLSCRWAQVVKGFQASQEFVRCGNFYRIHWVTIPVRECSAYDDKRLPSHKDMEKIAWVLLTKSAGRSIGFVTSAKFRELEGEDAEIIPGASIRPARKEE
jgi:hypothetical protein